MITAVIPGEHLCISVPDIATNAVRHRKLFDPREHEYYSSIEANANAVQRLCLRFPLLAHVLMFFRSTLCMLVYGFYELSRAQ